MGGSGDNSYMYMHVESAKLEQAELSVGNVTREREAGKRTD